MVKMLPLLSVPCSHTSYSSNAIYIFITRVIHKVVKISKSNERGRTQGPQYTGFNLWRDSISHDTSLSADTGSELKKKLVK